jgi:hypothetical protein
MHFFRQDCVNLGRCQWVGRGIFHALMVLYLRSTFKETGGDAFPRKTYRLNISETISTSVSAAAIFSAEEGCGRPPPNMLNDMAAVSVVGELRASEWGRISTGTREQVPEDELDRVEKCGRNQCHVR